MTQTINADDLLAQLDELDSDINESLEAIEEILEDLKAIASND